MVVQLCEKAETERAQMCSSPWRGDLQRAAVT